MPSTGFQDKLFRRRQAKAEAQRKDLADSAKTPVPSQEELSRLNHDVTLCREPDGQSEMPPPSVRELWDVAYGRLQDEDTALVSSFEEGLRSDANPGLTPSGSKVSRREMMEGILKVKMEEINEEVWKLRFGTTEVQVKDMVEPVLGVVNRMNQYINDALSSNPYASLAWAGVSLLLPLLLNPSTQAAALGKGLEYISNLITQSRMWEDLYVRRYETAPAGHSDASVSPTYRGYMDAMELLYRRILRFQITCCCFYARTDVSRLYLDTVKWHDWEKLLNDIRDQEEAFATVRALWRDNVYDEECRAVEQRHRETAARWDSLGSDLSALRRAVKAAQDKKENQELFDWLCSIDPSSIHNGARNKHESGTGEWLIKGHDQFKEWKTVPGSFLWLCGNAGCGKSILSSTVIAHLMDEHTADPTTGLAYFYFSFSDPGRQTLGNMLASLIKQLCCHRPVVPEAVANLQTFKERGQRPDAKTLTIALQASFQGFSSAYIVLDALDECPALNGERKRLLDTLREILAADIPNLHTFCTSRDEHDIRRALHPSPLYYFPRRGRGIMDAAGVIENDIKQYVESSLRSSDFESWPRDVKDEAETILIQKAGGMFQYVSLQLDTLRTLSSLPLIRETLRTMPAGLDCTYDRILQNIDTQFKNQVVSSLKWLAFSWKTPTLEEFAEVFVLRPGSTPVYSKSDELFNDLDVIKYFSGLVTVDTVRSGNVYTDTVDYYYYVRLAHFSIKEYLMSDRISHGPSAYARFTEAECHLHIAKLCLAYFIGSHYSRLWNYAKDYWARHLEEVPSDIWPVETMDMARCAVGINRDEDERVPYRWGIPKWLHLDIQPYPMLLRSLCWTARHGYVQLTDMLLSSHRYLMQEDLDAVLHQAALSGEIAVVRRMLERGAAVNTFHPVAGSALHAAATCSSVAGVNILLERGANIHAQWGDNGTPLHVASIAGKLAVIETLLQHGAGIDFEGGEYGTALQAACASGQNNAALLLLEHGANAHHRGGKYGSAWHAAAAYKIMGDRHEKLLMALLDHGVDVNDAQGGQHATALQATLEFDPRWQPRLIRFLIRHGADPNVITGEHGFFLQLACAKRSFPAIEVLLTECPAVDVNAQGGVFGSALQAAVSGGPPGSRDERRSVQLVRLLLERGADPNLRGGRYGSALNAAVVKGFWDTVDVLLAAGAKPDCKLLSEPNDEWLEQVRERDGSDAVARYKVFWDVEIKTGIRREKEGMSS